MTKTNGERDDRANFNKNVGVLQVTFNILNALDETKKVIISFLAFIGRR